MRLPLGILTGMGFIGGGAIRRRDSLVFGVTTAATLWFVTVVGLCFGGGQISLGIAAFVLGMLVLSGLRWFDYRMKQEQHGILSLTTEPGQPTEEEIRATVSKAGYRISVSSVAYLSQTKQRQLEFNLRRGVPQSGDVPPFLKEFMGDHHVSSAHRRGKELSYCDGHGSLSCAPPPSHSLGRDRRSSCAPEAVIPIG